MSERRVQRNKIRRQREVRRNLCLIIMTFSFIIILSISFDILKTKAKSDMTDVTYKYYTSIMVQTGDSLWSIADKYAVENLQNREHLINEIMQINSLQDDTLQAGQYIIVPYYSSEYIGAYQ